MENKLAHSERIQQDNYTNTSGILNGAMAYRIRRW